MNLLWPIAVPALIAGLLTAGIANAWRLEQNQLCSWAFL
ncbi:hypothetical protein CHCC15325_3690 [Bacillus licheniformis]|uniref:Uncharacterized protein n=1 Tax=Bacillus licheniformis (strain ATCC 14580 / DSM 13 / JCM 2505 / CCUG 7422 / NBRC 12200 / NCIMB 9375 / NCTC 10341 / NRRL NRS-1264 / Gibson 46) TaxID=279010 RepID=A4VFC4_BACLD|nr:hypothetical protein BL07047 [Bacillus licheniformis DSM 13 = ATCC 14580]TWJ37213.1 hypothetical protein CHCC5025_4580 [Bacillus licheniformis]TWN15898.1 hypothetical protein CHCC14564_0463 [Bacillus licheniformis LMG 17339]TWJ89805.1 hypothetical protein CHCC20496_2731 [Bacillus licheniformis]TWJ92821.1 hypothetical protein CHCC20493_4052 [Bacillus licheniformis]